MVTSPNADPTLTRFLSSVPENLRVAAVSALADRIAWMRQYGYQFDGSRDLYSTFGWTRTITISQMRMAYARGGIAKRIVNALPKATWRGGLEVVEDDDPKNQTEFEAAFDTLYKRLDLRSKFERQDRLSRIGEYGVLLIGVKGNGSLETELPKGGSNQDNVIFIRPMLGAGGPEALANASAERGIAASGFGVVSAANVTVEALEDDPSNPRYGQPKFYRLLAGSDINKASNSRVHWSRCIHICDDPLEDETYSDPSLSSVWNYLDDLQKLHGGGSEAFFQRANQGRVWSMDKDARKLDDDEKTEFADQVEKLQHGILKDIRVRGVDVKQLGSDVAQFAQSLDALMTLIAGSCEIPKRILTGSEMGELASSQDRDNWRDQVNGRRESHAWPRVVLALITRLLDYKYLPEPKDRSALKAKWGVVMNLTEDEKMTGAKSWAGTTVGGRPVFSDDEIRWQWYEKEPLKPEVKESIAPAPKMVAPFGAKRAAAEFKYSSAEVRFSDKTAQLFDDFELDPEDVIEREDHPHITVKYGLKTQDAEDVRPVLKGDVPEANLGKTAVFSNDEHDVLYVTVDSPDLHALNARLKASLPHVDTFPQYVPHATIAYLKPGTGKKYAGQQFGYNGFQCCFASLFFSNVDGEETEIPFNSSRSAGVSAKRVAASTPDASDTTDTTAVTAIADKIAPVLRTICEAAFAKVSDATLRNGEAAADALETALDASNLEDVLREALVAGARLESEALHQRVIASRFATSSFVSRLLKRTAKPIPRTYVFGQKEATAWAADHAAEMISDITETTRDQIRFLVALFEDGEITEAEYYREIRKAVGDADRAELIARTESMRATNAGRRAAWASARKLKVLPRNAKRVWISALDEARCKICAEFDGEKAPIGGTYSGGVDGPPAHPRCRCTEGLAL